MDKGCVSQVKGLERIIIKFMNLVQTFVSCTKNHPCESYNIKYEDDCLHVD